MIPPDDADDEERTIVRPPSARGAGAMAPTAAIAFPPAFAPTAAPATARQAAAPALGHTLPLGTRLRDYEITGLIGEGGFGIVYLAWDHSLQRKVAVKEYMPASMASRVAGSSAIVVKSDRHLDTFKAGLKSFVNEARLLARFDHPSLVKVYRFWEENGTAYMVMPFYEGPTLKTALAELGHVPSESELRAWLNPLLDALTVMHAAQCFHRDIAPDNILLTGSGPLLLDFGAARRVIGDMTHALTVVLKPGYAPIEQYGDVATMSQGAWTDLYALACVVYYAITGKTPMSSVERLMDDQLEPISAVAAGRYSPAFLGAIDAALAVRPQDRPQNEARFRALLDADLPAAAPSLAPPAPPVRHESFPGTEVHHQPTVRDALTPVLATQLLARAPADSGFAPSESSTFAASGPASLAPPESVLPATEESPRQAPAAPPHSRAPLLVVAGTIVGIGVVAAALWLWQQRESRPSATISPPTSGMPAGSVSPASPASPATLPSLPSPAIVVPSASNPTASTSLPQSPSDAASVAAVARPVEVPPAVPASSPVVVRETPVTRPRDAVTTAAPTAAPTLPRPRREVAPRVESPPETKLETPRRASGGARCSDILQKASLEPLTAEEAAYLKRECR